MTRSRCFLCRILVLWSAGLVLAGCHHSVPSPGSPELSADETRDEAPDRTNPFFPDVPQPPLEPARPADWLEDVTRAGGVDFTYRTGVEGGHFTILEMVGSGPSLLDYDGDGLVDLFLCGGGTISRETPIEITGLPSALYRNVGDLRFLRTAGPESSSAAPLYTHAGIVGDYDDDGFPDLFLTGYGLPQLWHNDGAGGFVEVTSQTGLPASGWTIAAVWADFNRDGLLDLALGGYATWTPQSQDVCGDPQRGIPDVCAPHNYSGAPTLLYLNRGDGRFEDVSQVAGMRTDDRAMGLLAADFNSDGWIDLYVANDEEANRLFLGGPEFPFREVGESSGTAFNEHGAREGSMGVDWGDYDGDGRGDLFVTNFEQEDNALYRHESNGQFLHVTARSGLAGPCRPLVGFGTGFADFDTDGWQDLFILNGHVFYQTGRSPYPQPSFVYKNQEGRRFADVSAQAGAYFRQPHVARGGAIGDLDNDGAVDLVVVHQNAPAVIQRNRLVPSAWVSLRLVARSGAREGVGAIVTSMYQGRELTRWVHAGGGYLSQFDRRIVLPIDSEKLPQVRVRWPGGREETFDGLTGQATNVLIEGRGRE
ncbi:MAG: CRTAC1 family protein [Planctomycetales bacterium]